VKRARKRPRGFYARIARARGVAVGAVYLELNPDKWPCVRAQQECDATWPWSQQELERMDRAFCNAVLREIARGTESPRGPAAKPAVLRTRRAPALPRRAASRDRRG
jgi:hypothetical protein